MLQNWMIIGCENWILFAWIIYLNNSFKIWLKPKKLSKVYIFGGVQRYMSCE
jgi:hypothetical protein